MSVELGERFGSGDGERKDVADTKDSLRAVACIRFVRPWWLVVGHVCVG